MKTIYKIISFLLWALVFLLILFNIDQLWLKITLSFLMIFIAWFAYHIERATPMKDDYDMNLKDYAQYLKDKK